MSKVALGALVGAGLGVIDGLSAWLSPEARPILLSIVVGSTLKGVVTGALAGAVARWRRSTLLGILAGVAIGFALSSLAAMGQPGHYLEIVLPGMIVGALAGFVTQRYPPAPSVTRRVGAALLLAVAAHQTSALQDPQSGTQVDGLAPLAPLIGRWVGTAEGQPGKGRVEREYRRALGARFIRVTNRSVYPPQDTNPRAKLMRTRAGSVTTWRASGWCSDNFIAKAS